MKRLRKWLSEFHLAISCFMIFSFPKDPSQSPRFAHPGTFGGLDMPIFFFGKTRISFEEPGILSWGGFSFIPFNALWLGNSMEILPMQSTHQTSALNQTQLRAGAKRGWVMAECSAQGNKLRRLLGIIQEPQYFTCSPESCLARSPTLHYNHQSQGNVNLTEGYFRFMPKILIFRCWKIFLGIKLALDSGKSMCPVLFLRNAFDNYPLKNISFTPKRI